MLDFSEMCAANEDDYRCQPHRTAPISSTITPIHNYPKKLRIYLTNASPYWQVCCYFKGKTYKRSLKTTIRQVAIRAAKDYFHQMVANLYGSTITPREDRALLFSDLVAPTIAIETARTQRGDYSIAGLNILRNRLHKSVEPHFGKMPIDKVGYNEISEFLQHLSRLKKSPTTIQQHMVATRKVMNYAYANNYIKHLPKFPTVKINSSPRGSFNLAEYRLLVQTAKRYVHTKIVDPNKSQRKRGRFHMEAYLTISPELQWLIRFMVNSFVRPTDIKNLQHQHITVVRNEHTYLRMNLTVDGFSPQQRNIMLAVGDLNGNFNVTYVLTEVSDSLYNALLKQAAKKIVAEDDAENSVTTEAAKLKNRSAANEQIMDKAA